MAPITIGGHKAYGVYIIPGMGFRQNDATGVAIDDEPEGIYYVIDGTHFDSGCCFDYGNSSTNGRAVGTGTMETTYFGTATAWGSGNGPGPWIMSDMEAGFEVGQKIGIDIGGHYDLATVTAVGKAATQTMLSAAAIPGATNIKVAADASMTVGDALTVGTGGRKEIVTITNVGTPGANGTGVDVASPLRFAQMSGVDESDVGTGISFTPATKFARSRSAGVW